jgi:Brp/Blh family beta-carotene 15,15'-monooxygenase
VCLAIVRLGEPGELERAAVMAGLVAVVGLPHGAFDLHLGGEALRGPVGRWWWVLFGGVYALVALVAVGLWVWAPLVGLVALLALGVWHWGEEDAAFDGMCGRGVVGWYAALARGAVPVAGPCVFFPERTAEIFGWLLGSVAEVDGGFVRVCGLVAGCLALPGLIGAAVLAWSDRSRSSVRRWLPGVEMGVLVWLTAIAPPLLSFAVYFCVFHSVRHSLRSAAGLEGGSVRRALSRYGRAVALPTALTVIAGAAALWLLPLGELGREGLTRVVFVGLFALTVPHVMLEYAMAWSRRRGW